MMRNKTVLLYLLLCILPAVLSVRSVAGSGAIVSLPAGSWWRLSYTDHTDVAGKGAYAGAYVDDSHGSRILTVLSNDGTTLTLKRHWEGWQDTSTAQGSYWIQYNGGSPTYSGSGTLPDRTYTIDIATLDVVAINGTKVSEYGTGYVTQTERLTVGSNLPTEWTDSSGKSIEVQYVLNEFKTTQIGAANVQVAVFSYTGQSTGTIKIGNMNDTGPETDTERYDTNYGLLLGYSISGTYALSTGGGSFTETYTYEDHATDTNILFQTPTPSQSQPTLSSSATTSSVQFNLFTPITLGVIAIALTVIGAYIFIRPKTAHSGVERVKRCKVCHSELPADAMYCDECGTPTSGH